MNGGFRLISILLIAIGGLIVVSAMLYLLFNLQDRVIFAVGIPGIVIGLLFIAAGLYSNRVRRS